MSDIKVTTDPSKTRDAAKVRTAMELVRDGMPVEKAEKKAGIKLRRIKDHEELAQVAQGVLKEWHLEQQLRDDVVEAKMMELLFHEDPKVAVSAGKALMGTRKTGVNVGVFVRGDNPEVEAVRAEVRDGRNNE